jgi:hypothetical protein|tara:strand:+ start:263 stop:502 length:240 start_codon:yes stop_codon:yes gene_type:complete
MKLLITTLTMLFLLISCNDNRGKKGDVVLEMQSNDTYEWQPVALHFGSSREETNYGFCEEHLNLLKNHTTYKHRCVPIK